MPKKTTSTVSSVTVSTAKTAAAEVPKNKARKLNLETFPAASDKRLAALDVVEATADDKGVITGLNPDTKYRLMQIDSDSNIEPINAALMSGGKIRKGVLITKIVQVEDD
jgi:hypothetical protein